MEGLKRHGGVGEAWRGGRGIDAVRGLERQLGGWRGREEV